MKNTSLSILGILPTLITLSFTSLNTENELIVVKLTSKKPLKFDMVQDERAIKDIKTPYEFIFHQVKENFVFKTNRSTKALKLNLDKKHGNLNVKWKLITLAQVPT